jgi:hypothetical protein
MELLHYDFAENDHALFHALTEWMDTVPTQGLEGAFRKFREWTEARVHLHNFFDGDNDDDDDDDDDNEEDADDDDDVVDDDVVVVQFIRNQDYMEERQASDDRPPVPYLPINVTSSSLHLLNLHPEEVARYAHAHAHAHARTTRDVPSLFTERSRSWGAAAGK